MAKNKLRDIMNENVPGNKKRQEGKEAVMH